MEEKDDNKRVLKLLSKKLKMPEYKELMEEFVKELLPFCSNVDSRIDEIYELCIEKIIREQATAFYNDFPISEIKSQLVEDLVRMENFRRKDNFGDFCLALYQQIECITNYLCRCPQLDNIVTKMWGYPAYVKSGKGIDVSISVREGEYTIGKFVLVGKDDKKIEKSKMSLQNIPANDKIRTIVYFFGYRAMLRNVDYDSFIEITSLLNDIYNCRNLNHRGNILNPWEQEILDRVLPLQSFYYFKFMGVLAQYVSFIKNGLDFFPTLVKFANEIEKKDLKLEPVIISEAQTKIIEGKVMGDIIRVKSQSFDVRIKGKPYVVKGVIQAGVKKNDVIEIDGYQIVYGNNISLNSYKKV